MLSTAIILPLGVTFGLLASGLIGWWYIWPRIRDNASPDVLIPLIIPHAFRYLGLTFLIDGVSRVPLDPRFADPTAYGDLLSAVLALTAVFALRANSRLAIPIVWVFSVVGVLDFVNAFTRGMMYLAPGDFGATYYIPLMLVPPFMITHFLVIARLRLGFHSVPSLTPQPSR